MWSLRKYVFLGLNKRSFQCGEMFFGGRGKGQVSFTFLRVYVYQHLCSVYFVRKSWLFVHAKESKIVFVLNGTSDVYFAF